MLPKEVLQRQWRITSFAQAAYFLDLQVHSRSTMTELSREQLQQLSPCHSAAETLTRSLPQDLPADSTAVATVSFSARFILQDKLQQLELSRCVHCAGRWFYLDGELTPIAVQKIRRNDACPCGSGKKYKVCQHR